MKTIILVSYRERERGDIRVGITSGNFVNLSICAASQSEGEGEPNIERELPIWVALLYGFTLL